MAPPGVKSAIPIVLFTNVYGSSADAVTWFPRLLKLPVMCFLHVSARTVDG